MSERTIVDVPARIVNGKVVDLDPHIERRCNLGDEIHENGIGVPAKGDPWVIIGNTGEPVQIPSHGVVETHNLADDHELVFFQADDEHGQRHIVVLPPVGGPVILVPGVNVIEFATCTKRNGKKWWCVAIEVIGPRRRAPKKRKLPYIVRSVVDGWQREQSFGTSGHRPPYHFPVPTPNMHINFGDYRRIDIGSERYSYYEVHVGPWGLQMELEHGGLDWYDICRRRFSWSEMDEIEFFMSRGY